MRPQASHSSHQTDTRQAARRRASLRAILLATSALVSAALPTTVARAITAQPGDATWLATQPPNDNDTGNFNNPNHWIGSDGITHSLPSGTATFNASDTRDITFNQIITLGGIAVTSDARDYRFDTNGFAVTFTGAGLSVGSGASLKFTNNASFTTFRDKSTAGQAQISITSGEVLFRDGSSADHAQIAVSGGAQLDFTGNGVGNDNSSAANANITTKGDVFFFGASTAANASIEIDAGGTVLFLDQSTGGNAGGNASINVLTGGALDISFHDTGIALGSLEGSGDVFLGGNTLTVGANDKSTTFSGGIHDGTSPEGIALFGDTTNFGSLTKVGKGALTLTGINTYTGTTTVNGGALVVDGSIASSIGGVTVNAGGTLSGTGTVSGTIVDGGTLAPGHGDGSVGTLKVQGDLRFTTTAGTTYLVQVTPANAASTSVTGVATLQGATVKANFAPGTYVKNEYGILHADGGVVGQFGSPLVTTNLSSMFKATLSYDANGKDVSLDLSANPLGGGGGGSGGGGMSFAGFNTNQNNVGNGIVNSRNLTGGLPAAFMTLTPAGVTQISGETAVGSQQATFDAMNQFMGVLLDPTVGALSGGRANDALAAMPRKAAPLAEAFDARWGVWAAGFGGSQSTSGDAVLGSNKTTSNVFGSAAGAEYRFSPNTVAGFALAGGGTSFRVANGGSGSSDLFQAGAYVKHTQGAAFIAAALAYGWQDVTTNRTVTVASIDSLRANFKTNALSGRLEGGYKVATAAGDITPYAAGQFTSYHLPSYAEQVAFGANTFALSYNGKDVTATRSELGLRSEKAVALTDATLMLRGRVAWAHDFNTDRNVQATFQTLPGSAFVVNGANPAADTALTTVAAEMLWRNGWSASATADAQLSDTTHSYSGKGVVRYSW
jgi:autotransporter-associated beta strand protein